MKTDAEMTTFLGKDEDPNEMHTTHKAEEESEFRETLEAAYNEHKTDAEADEDIDEARELREELEKAFPGNRASSIVKGFLSIDAAMRQDPVNAGDTVAEFYARNAPFGEPKPEKELKNNFGEVGVRLANGIQYAQPDSIRHTFLLAKQQAEKDEGEKEQLKEMQKMLSQRYPGKKFSEALTQVVDFNRAASKNPYQAGAKLAAAYGMPLNDEQAAFQNEAERKGAEAGHLIETEFRSLKGREGEVAEIIQRGIIPRTGDTRTDLKAASDFLKAYETPVQMQTRANAEIKAFEAKHPKFNQHRPQIAALLRTGKADSLQQAYNMVTGGVEDDIKRAVSG